MAAISAASTKPRRREFMDQLPEPRLLPAAATAKVRRNLAGATRRCTPPLRYVNKVHVDQCGPLRVVAGGAVRTGRGSGLWRDLRPGTASAAPRNAAILAPPLRCRTRSRIRWGYCAAAAPRR